MRIFDIGAKDGPEDVSDRILTVPNLLSLLRLLALPWIYADLVRGPDTHLRALVVLGVFAATDWLDGYVARRFDQVSKLGKLFDPITDRLLVAVVGVAMIVADLLPWWVIAVLVTRDVILLVGGAVLLRRGIPPPAVTRVGKAATFGLMFAFPFFILASVLGDGPSDPHDVMVVVAWITLVANTVLYYVAAGQYVRYAWSQIRSEPSTPS